MKSTCVLVLCFWLEASRGLWQVPSDAPANPHGGNDQDDDEDYLDDDLAEPKPNSTEPLRPVTLLVRNPLNSTTVAVSFKPPPDFEERALLTVNPRSEVTVHTDAGHLFYFRDAESSTLLNTYEAPQEAPTPRYRDGVRENSAHLFVVPSAHEEEKLLRADRPLSGKAGRTDPSGKSTKSDKERAEENRVPCEDVYKEYLSVPGDLPRTDRPKLFPGLHALCVWAGTDVVASDVVYAEAFAGGVDYRGSADPAAEAFFFNISNYICDPVLLQRILSRTLSWMLFKHPNILPWMKELIARQKMK